MGYHRESDDRTAARRGNMPRQRSEICAGAPGFLIPRRFPHDLHSSVRPEDVARSELFYSSTCCWV